MESNTVKRMDVKNIMVSMMRRFWIIALIAVVCAVGLFGYEYYQYKVQQSNQAFVNATVKPTIYASYSFYIWNFDDNESYYNRIDDVKAVIKSYTNIQEVIEKSGVEATYEMMLNCIAMVSQGVNGIEVSVEGSIPGWSQEQVLDIVTVLEEVSTRNIKEHFGANAIEVIEEPHEGAYTLHYALTDDEEKKPITKKDVIKYGFYGGFAGGCFGVFAVLFYLLLSAKLRTADEAHTVLGAKVIAELRRTRKDQGQAGDKSAQIQAFNKEEYKKAVRQLQTGVVGVFSVIETESRGEVAKNLAKTLAVNGKSALLITIKKDSDVAANPLNEFLDSKKTRQELVSDSDNEKIKVANWTTASSEDVDLFKNGKISQLIFGYENEYDYVVIDAPAFKESACALDLAATAKNTVLVVDEGTVWENDAIDVRVRLSENYIETTGIIYIR